MTFSSDVSYVIKDASNPHNMLWWGHGNNTNTIYNENEVKGISWHKKEIIIYI